MVLARIEALLKERMGLDAVSIGTASVERAVKQRLAAHELEEVQPYWDCLIASEAELQELIEAVVVGETWFFRDQEAFAVLARLAQEETLRRPAEHVFRILSLPCSTGEEPYSMAMTLLDAGISAQRFQIDAVDISGRAIAYAERGVYGKNSFRGQDISFRDRHFESTERHYRVSAAVRRQVRFRHGNMLAVGWLPGSHAYEAIFCRNVLIYFDRPTQERALEVLSRLLVSHGMMFVGPSETALLMDHAFVSVPAPRAFAFRKPQSAPIKVKPPSRVAAAAAPPQPLQSAAKQKATQTKAAPAVSAPRAEPNKTNDRQWIEEAQRLANEGKLIEAMKSCEQHLRDQPASAEAFYLIGLLHDAARHPHEAAQYYRKALYLDPKHHEALVHLAVVLQNEGDAKGAKRLLERAKRGEAKA